MERIAMDFEQEFKVLYRPLCLFALQYIPRTEDAEDIVQQAFADVWEKLLILTREKEELLEGNIPDEADDSDEEQIRIAERDARLWTAIDKLPPERRKIFLVSKRDGLKYQEIADELHISVKTVENQISKALKSLRDTAIKIYTFFFG